MKAAVLLTASAGGKNSVAQQQETARRVEQAFDDAGVAGTVAIVEGSELPEAVRSAVASDADIVVIGGGDGSISTAAAVLVDGAKPLAVLPLGTLNHFAKDLGMPLELEEAVRVIALGHVREIDVGEVNGLIFVNNSSVGLYPRAVARRDEHQQRRGWPKWPAMLVATMTVLRQFRLLRINLHADVGTSRVSTPFVFVGNNEYEMNLFSMGRRTCLDGGVLGLYIARISGRLGLLRLLLHAVVGRLEQAREFESQCLLEFEIETRRRTVQVARDGEVTRMRTPLRYRVRARALRVIAPPPPSPPPSQFHSQR